MAGTRLQKLGTVFTRVSSLLNTGVMKEAEKPLWFEVMAAFPPKIEPKFDRFLDETPVPEILYEEDRIRAKYYDSIEHNDVMDLSNIEKNYSCLRFMDQIKLIKKRDPELNDDKAFDIAAEELNMKKSDLD